MAKRRKSSASVPFSMESLREEVDIEINNENKGSRILADLGSLNLNRLDHVSADVVLCSIIVKFGLSLVGSIAGVAPSLRVLPLVVQHQVLKILCPTVDEGDRACLLQCVLKLPKFPLADNNTAFHVFTPPCDGCSRCHSQLASYNNPVLVAYHHLNGASKGVKVSLKCNRCGIYYGYSKYGNPGSGWNLYDAPRPAVEATDVCFVQRLLLGWHVSLA